MTNPSDSPRDLFARLRARRLTTTFALLATLSAGILIGSVLTRTAVAKDQVDSSRRAPALRPCAGYALQ